MIQIIKIIEIKGVEKKPSPFDILIILVKFDISRHILEFGQKKESVRYESDLTDSKI